MKSKQSVLFRISQAGQHRIRFGEVGNLFQSCYFRGKQLGYEDISFFHKEILF